ncbi:molybdopterin molybdotransferase MoeA [Haloferula rosea]|uniref:Molybdopterin molybdenumtransferase n=1 Tax=Haloferula rosea TaxID=490093 RepID=A0A934R8A2_9BACT|nr:molybdopterin molybdotransferase MoeA [Haloferula rosea]MBK1827084.1 molybdopterin molybdotransferase MoeA [Haloferula rosea]
MADLLSVAEADACIRESMTTLPAERATLSRAIGRRLLSPVLADRSLPPYDRSMMDGIAFSSSSINPDKIEIAGLHAAGDPPPDALEAGQAWEIMTGAMVPEDCDTVVPYESLADDHSRITSRFKPGQFIHKAGSDAKEGDILIPAGTTLGAPEVAIAASVGQNSLTVPRLPRVGILTTGDEAIHPAATPKPWQIRRSNGPTLAALISMLGLPLNFHQHGPDDEDALTTLLEQAMESVDLLIISGGISKGKKDFVRRLLDARLGKPAFHGIALRPGKPLAFWPGPPDVFALPGNPVSALATFARFVRPALHQLQGLAPPTRLLRAPDSLEPLEHLTWLAPVAVATGKKTTLHPPQNSGDYISISPSTGVLEVPPVSSFSRSAALTYYPYAL